MPRLIIILTPLLLTPVVGFMLAEGLVNLGGGEKDIIFLIPWALWSILFAIAGLALWKKKTEIMPWLIHTVAWSFGILFILWSLLLAYSLFAG